MTILPSPGITLDPGNSVPYWQLRLPESSPHLLFIRWLLFEIKKKEQSVTLLPRNLQMLQFVEFVLCLRNRSPFLVSLCVLLVHCVVDLCPFLVRVGLTGTVLILSLFCTFEPSLPSLTAGSPTSPDHKTKRQSDPTPFGFKGTSFSLSNEQPNRVFYFRSVALRRHAVTVMCTHPSVTAAVPDQAPAEVTRLLLLFLFFYPQLLFKLQIANRQEKKKK